LLTAVDLYGAGMIGYLVMRPVDALSSLWPVVAIGTLLQWVLLPAIPLFFLALVLKSWRSTVLLGIAAVAYPLLFGGLFLPKPNRANDRSGLTVMTYNTAQGRAEWEGLEQVIRESRADVVTIQESTDEQVPLYRRALSDLYPYQAFYGTGVDGIEIISRYPIDSEKVTYFASYRPYLIADLDVGERTLTVISAHPPVMLGPGEPAASGRADYVMLADLAMERGKTIVAGDLNLTDQHNGYSTIIARDLVDAQREVGFGFGLTFPRRLHLRQSVPPIRIDYILTTPDLRPIRTWVGEDGGSDHLPVLATIARREGDGE
jgi:vancomycin resistance protein VanJ